MKKVADGRYTHRGYEIGLRPSDAGGGKYAILSPSDDEPVLFADSLLEAQYVVNTEIEERSRPRPPRRRRFGLPPR